MNTAEVICLPPTQNHYPPFTYSYQASWYNSGAQLCTNSHRVSSAANRIACFPLRTGEVTMVQVFPGSVLIPSLLPGPLKLYIGKVSSGNEPGELTPS